MEDFPQLDVTWTDGPTMKQVAAITMRYERRAAFGGEWSKPAYGGKGVDRISLCRHGSDGTGVFDTPEDHKSNIDPAYANEVGWEKEKEKEHKIWMDGLIQKCLKK